MIDIMLYEQVKNLYFNYLKIRPTNEFNDFTYVRGDMYVTTRKNTGNNREVGKRD